MNSIPVWTKNIRQGEAEPVNRPADFSLTKQLLFASLFLFLTLPAFSQSVVHIEIRGFKKENGSLSVSYRARISPKAVETSRSLRFYPVVEAGATSRILPGATILGRSRGKAVASFDKAATGEFIPAGTKGEATLDCHVKIPYARWMDSASLVLHQEITGYGKRKKRVLDTYRFNNIGSNDINISSNNNDGAAVLAAVPASREPGALRPSVAFIIPQKDEIKRRGRQVKTCLDFQSGQSVILPGYGRNPGELAKIGDAIRGAVDNPDATLQSISVVSYASPEGTYAVNERLSKERAQALKEYIRGKFGLNDGLFSVNYVAEDWDGLLGLVQASEIEYRDQILEIISSVGIHEGREARLMRLGKGAPYRSMLKEMFPGLRRAECRFDYIVKEYGLEESAVVLEKRPGDLSQFELYNLALSYGAGSKEYRRILLETIPQYFPGDGTANSNAVAVLIGNGETVAAGPYLEKAGDSGPAQNNRGVAALLNGDMEKAEACFKKAQSLGCSEAAANLEQLRDKRK